jgi:hypothetical protein
MAESRKIAEYRKTLGEVAQSARKSPETPASGGPRRHQQHKKEGEAAKLGLEIDGEESKRPPRASPRNR